MGTKPVQRITARRTVAILAALAALAGVVQVVDRLVLHPWSWSVTGAPTLTGYWEGEATLGPDDTRRFVMHLRYDAPGSRCRSGCSRIEGDANLCGPSEQYELAGDADNRSGSRFSVGPFRTSGAPGKVLEELYGEWVGDRITIRTSFHVVDADGTARSSTADARDARIELRRGDKAGFERGC